MARIIWIASYPKSGNTWVRFLLANLAYGPISSSAQLADLIPDVHESVRNDQIQGNQNRFVKTHWRLDDDMPMREDTVGAIYVARHPLQVMVSNLNYYVLSHGGQYFGGDDRLKARIRNAYIDRYIEDGGEPTWKNHGIGSWDENVESWTASNLTIPVVVAKYEDIMKDTHQFLHRLCQFLNWDKSPKHIEQSIAASTFDAMRRMENQEIESGMPGYFAKPEFAAAHRHGRRFMNVGKTATFHDTLSPAQVAAAARRFKGVMERLGYSV